MHLFCVHVIVNVVIVANHHGRSILAAKIVTIFKLCELLAVPELVQVQRHRTLEYRYSIHNTR